MNCTFYNDPSFTYNAPINYNGVCVSPVPSGGGGGGIWDFQPQPVVMFPKREREEEEAIVMILNQLLLDDE